MKTRIGLMVLIVLMGGLILNSSNALAQTQGNVAVKLAALLGMDSSSVENAIAALMAAGIVIDWNAKGPVVDAFSCGLLKAVNSAIETGKVVPPATLPSASALVAAAETATGMPSNTVVNAITACGGNRDQASAGASYGVSYAAAPAGGFGGYGPASYGAGGGGGKVGTQSR